MSNPSILNKNQLLVQAAFATAQQAGRAAFIPYLTAGFPNATQFVELASQLLIAADILEVGIPYSDPLGDGPTIQQASEQALAAGTSTRQTLQLVAKLRQSSVKPIMVMTYINPIYAVGPSEFMQLAASAGVTGLILPDLPPDQDREIAALAAEYGLTVTFLIAPTSTPERIKLVTEACTGFVYAMSVTGVTGTRTAQALDEVPAMLQLARQHTSLPIAVGFGVKDKASAQQVAQVSDGVVVGSALVAAVQRGDDLTELATDLLAGCQR